MLNIDTGILRFLPRHDHIDRLAHCVAIPPTQTHGCRIFVFPCVFTTSSQPARIVRYFDVNQDEWVDTPATISHEGNLAAARLTDTSVIVSMNERNCILFDTDTYKMTELPDRLFDRLNHVAVHYRGMVVLIGGFDTKVNSVRICEQYTQSVGAWELMGEVPTEADYTRAAVVDDKIYAVCGLIGGRLHMYDGATWNDIDIDLPDMMHCGLFDYKGTPALLRTNGQIQTLDLAQRTWTAVDGVTGPTDGAQFMSELFTF